MPDIVAGLVGMGFLALWIYCLFDVVTTPENQVQHLPKVLWVIIVFVLFDLGSILWLAVGRPRVWTKRAAAGTATGRHSGMRQPTLDDPSLVALDPVVRHREEMARMRMWEAQLKRREEALRQRELDPGDDPPRPSLGPG